MVWPAWGKAARRPPPSRALPARRARMVEANRPLADQVAGAPPGEACPPPSGWEGATPRISSLPSACAPTVCRASRTRARTGPSTSLRAAAPFPAHPSSGLLRRRAGSSRQMGVPRRRRRSRPSCSLNRFSTPSACAPTASPTFRTLNRAMAALASQLPPARAATSTPTTLSSRRLRRHARRSCRGHRRETLRGQPLLGVVCASRRGLRFSAWWDFRGVVGPFLACHEQQMSIRARQEGRNHTEKSGFWGGPVGCTNGYDTSPFL